MIADAHLMVTHADAGKSVLPIRALDHRGDDLVENTQKPFHIHFVDIAVRKLIVEQAPQSLLQGSEDTHVERLKQPRAFCRHEQGPQARGVHGLEDFVSEVGIGHVERKQKDCVWARGAADNPDHADHLHHVINGVPGTWSPK